MIFRTKHKLDFTPMACDAKYVQSKPATCYFFWSVLFLFVCAFVYNRIRWIFRGKIVLGYTEAELRVRGSGYQFIHAADMLYCAENHVRSKSAVFN